ncbi:hypothetical protein [Streptomyces sp. NPDC001530]|uniref:hypothetical protein n=1 Tax=Streptomyces sp. NPDC001530 TaxID=3364582 RepID=UPI003699297E
MTIPTAGCRPQATAAHPATTVVATEPRAPISQIPVRGTAGVDVDVDVDVDGVIASASLPFLCVCV